MPCSRPASLHCTWQKSQTLSSLGTLAARRLPAAPLQIEALIEAHVAAHLPRACNASIKLLGFRAHPYSQPKDTMPNRAAAKAGARAKGAARVWARAGAACSQITSARRRVRTATDHACAFAPLRFCRC